MQLLLHQEKTAALFGVLHEKVCQGKVGVKNWFKLLACVGPRPD